MRVESQVCTLSQAKKLKELGVEQDAIFSWFGDEMPRLMDNCADGIEYGPWVFVSQTIPVNNQQADHRSDVQCSSPIAATFTTSELRLLLPEYVGKYRLSRWGIPVGVNGNIASFGIQYRLVADRPAAGAIPEACIFTDAEAHGLCDMLIHLLETNLITVAEVNARMKEGSV